MSRSVDVLAVLDRLQSDWRDESQIVGRWDSADDLATVRAAVAELIEAAEETRVDASILGMEIPRLEAAIARAKGDIQ